MLKLTEYFYQLPRMPDSFQNIATVKHVIAITGTFAALAWIAPKFEWKKHL